MIFCAHSYHNNESVNVSKGEKDCWVSAGRLFHSFFYVCKFCDNICKSSSGELNAVKETLNDMTGKTLFLSTYRVIIDKNFKPRFILRPWIYTFIFIKYKEIVEVKRFSSLIAIYMYMKFQGICFSILSKHF